jgi:uncharacterized membrane protein YkoI
LRETNPGDILCTNCPSNQRRSIMQAVRISSPFTRTILISILVAAVGCRSAETENEESDEGETRVELAQLPAAARASVEKLTAGGHVDKIDREIERGVAAYDVEATVGGKHVEYLVAEKDGAVLGTETSVEIADLPTPVREAAETFFGTTSDLEAMKGVEFGETSYEIVGKKDGKRVEVTFDPTGKRIP